MKALRNYLNRIKPNFEPGGKLHSFQSVFDGFETFLYTPNTTSTSGVNIHDSLDSKRIMIIVVLALMPCLLFGMYNTGYQNWLAAGATEFPFWQLMMYGFLAVLPRIVVAYVVGLGIEFAVAQWRREEIQEGFLVTGILIPLICPVETPLWMLAVATAFSVIFVKEVFGGTGYNVFNVALVTRAFLFFAYPAQMSGDKVFVSSGSILGLGYDLPDGFTGATPLGQIASFAGDKLELLNLRGDVISTWDAFIGLIPGSFGETSTLCILIGAAILLATGIASWRIMLSVVAGGLLMGWIANVFETSTYPASFLSPLDQLLYGGFAFAAVFMATDPVTAARTGAGKYIYGLLVGVMAVLIRTYNNGYPEGAMLAVLLANALAPLIDHCVVQANVSRRMRRLKERAKA
ncbi:NADH:ubiquinone reductase (Na(+)-transporting) subunit B [Duncaniella freteri]|mgnify:FL=1|jgi:Na+-transporting NADH:ubiquinone oxidoreductase subunit B|uniref:Na(+)-translocating NADH-quinone reductase subunit B n=7 Tax=Duncaniella TaxID=2518495 RepID=A0A4Z0V5R6_9BACT|nr:NADH:ubiquinone reductase (Na(+)-transporting) subunit B [Duncaniella freteri]MDE7027197.1 NADH:ubiquinone reductase (Na(+)-transporting) subunit B [Duncaniella freteri]NBJ05619.1 NADH:ubiquinone reductase (Na(+)-transporting) subunit B [Alistipes sp. Z76]NCE67614.1 NADH:ubiquinone reductase (Na(+)-transporting) subunit B [Muribaculaceae bacterium M3]TGG39594.1 NADH:ubiquinone reductase (Na(+)-transporting) subunit B [Duncaniella freteri]